MKYNNSSNKPLVCMQTQSTCYKGTRKMAIKGILWHSTGANNPNLKRYVQPSDTKPSADTYSKAKWLEVLGKNSNNNDMNHIYREMGMNAWIGKLADGTVACIQTMPWDYRPWGCASGNKGSCNDGWIQFEICEDGLTDQNYFNKIYKEACEITAYLCKLYDIDPKGFVTHNGVKVPTILCHQDSYQLGLGSNHGDIYHWFPKFGKSMETVRTDVAALLKITSNSTTSSKAPQVTESTSTAVKTYKVITEINKYTNATDAAAQKNALNTKLAIGTYYIYTKYPTGVNGMYNISTDKTGKSAGSWINPKENVIKENTNTSTQKLYRVRKSKDDAASQKGAFSDLANAKDCCQTAGVGYHVFDWNYKIVYSYKAPATPITVSSIAVTTMPKKISYTVGDSYDSTGLVITATYSDKTKKVITDYKTTGFNSTKVGTSTVTISYEGKTTTFKVTIKEKEIPKTNEKVVAVYDLDYPEKTKIIDSSIKRTDKDCVKAIKKILTNNKSFDVNIAKAYFTLAPKYNIDPLMAISQAILETGWFKFQGSSVSASQHNYCGLGATGGGEAGASFATIEEGIIAQLQHLFAYGCKTALSTQDKVVDPRFSLVTRGVAVYWQQLAGRWACPGYDKNAYDTPLKAMKAENTYGQKILSICKSIMAISVTTEELNKYFPTEFVSPDVEITDTNVNQPSEDEQINSIIGTLTNMPFTYIKKLIKTLINLFIKGE